MEQFKVAATQVNSQYQDLEYNLATHLRLMQETADAGCRMVVFPELSVTGHNASAEVVRFAEAADGSIFHAMHQQAKACHLIVGYGFCELLRGTHYNAYALVGPDGLIGIQRKVHASYDEFFRFRQAYEWHVFDVGFCKVGTAICHDADFFESWRILALKGAEVCLLPHAIRHMDDTEGISTFGSAQCQAPDDELIAKQKRLTESRPLHLLHDVQAKSNGVYAVFSDQVGFDGHSSHVGGAYILNPEGKLLAHTEPAPNDAWVSATLDPEMYQTVRRNPWFALRKRRPETYGELTHQL